jgi:hypothetical protein
MEFSMQRQGIAVPSGNGADEVPALPPALLEGAVRAAVAVILQQQAAVPQEADGYKELPALLTPAQVQKLTGWSRSEVNRMLHDGRLPSIAAGSGTKQKKRWVSKAFILKMLQDLNTGRSITSLRDYTAQWQAGIQAPAQHAAVPEAMAS